MEKFLKRVSTGDIYKSLDEAGRKGVAALQAATPIDTGETSGLWSYRIKRTSKGVSIEWYNGNIVDGVPVAILLQYGHGTGTGGYVAGRDYINPAMRPIFDEIANNVWKAVTA